MNFVLPHQEKFPRHEGRPVPGPYDARHTARGRAGSIARGDRADQRHVTRGAFTLVEVLATMLLMAIVLPAVMQGIALATGAATVARQRAEASGLAESKLNEIVATGQWQNGNLTGDFSPATPDYHWQATVQAWAQDTSTAGLQQIDLKVFWTARNREESVTLSTLAYARTAQ